MLKRGIVLAVGVLAVVVTFGIATMSQDTQV